jgi:heptosyltransferase-1
MGDILHAMPAVTALREEHPDWHFGWLLEERWQPLLRSRADAAPRSCAQPLVDRVHVAQLKRWRKAWFSRQTRYEYRALISELRAANYDTVIDIQGAIRSAWLARRTRAQRIIGEQHPREGLARFLFTERIATRGKHVIEQDLELTSALAGTPLPYRPALLPHDDQAAQWAAQHISDNPVVLLNPGAGWGAKCWPAERYGRVAQALTQWGCDVLINAGPAERELAQEVVFHSSNSARDVECSIQQLIELTRKAALFVGGDTGPLHLAAALEVPSVAIFGPTDPARNGPYGNRNVVLRSPSSRRDHSRRRTPEPGLLTITPADVLAAARNLLGERV